MWAYEYSSDTTAAPEQIWSVLSDLNNWASWDTSMDWVRLDQPLAVGAEVTMKPSGQDPITSVVTDVQPHRRYADRCDFGGVVLAFSHTLDPLPRGGTRVVHRLEISGEHASEIGRELGPQISADFPESMTGLLSAGARA